MRCARTDLCGGRSAMTVPTATGAVPARIQLHPTPAKIQGNLTPLAAIVEKRLTEYANRAFQQY